MLAQATVGWGPLAGWRPGESGGRGRGLPRARDNSSAHTTSRECVLQPRAAAHLSFELTLSSLSTILEAEDTPDYRPITLLGGRMDFDQADNGGWRRPVSW